MFLSDGLDMPIHRSMPVSRLERRPASGNRRPIRPIKPFTPVWWLLVAGALLGAAAIAALVS